MLQAQRWKNVALSPVLLRWETAAIRLSSMVGHTLLPGDFGVFLYSTLILTRTIHDRRCVLTELEH